MSYILTPENDTGPLILNDRYIMTYFLNSEPSNENVRKIEQIQSAGVDLRLEFKVKINNQFYSACLKTNGSENVTISTDEAHSILDYESSEGTDLYGNPVLPGTIRTEVINKLARAGEKELVNLENKIFSHQNRL